MKKLLIALCVLFLAVPALAQVISYSDKELGRRGFSLFVEDDDIDQTAELLTELDTSYVQLGAEDQIEILSDVNEDTNQTITVEGIDDSGDWISEEFDLSGTTATLSSATFRYIEQAYSNSPVLGTVTIRDEADTFITSIPAYDLQTQMAQRFAGERTIYITGWHASALTTTGNVTLEMRLYADDEYCQSPLVGYTVLDKMYVDAAATSPYNPMPHVFSQPIEIPAGSWLAIYGTGSAANSDAAVMLQGFDLNK